MARAAGHIPVKSMAPVNQAHMAMQTSTDANSRIVTAMRDPRVSPDTMPSTTGGNEFR
jgi:hypothetical protein